MPRQRLQRLERLEQRERVQAGDGRGPERGLEHVGGGGGGHGATATVGRMHVHGRRVRRRQGRERRGPRPEADVRGARVEDGGRRCQGVGDTTAGKKKTKTTTTRW